VFLKQLGRLFVFLFGMLLVDVAMAATERYDYDPLGRLVRMVDGSNRATAYVYDAAGNLLEVRTGAEAAAPVVSGVTPAFLRRNETRAITIAGSGFLGASVIPAEAELDISGLQVTATQIKFNLTASANATVGPQSITISSAAGSTSAGITVAPLLPRITVDPTPLAIPPDSVARQITIRLANADAIDHIVALSASNSNIAVSPATVTIPAGQTSAPANIRGISAGQSNLRLSSATLGTLTVPVFVTAEFRGITTSMAQQLGVVLESAPTTVTTHITPVASVPLGVLVGSAVVSVAPDHLNVGLGPVVLTIRGAGLAAAQTVAVEPDAGLTVGAPVAAVDGLTITVPVTVAAGAPPTQRRVVVRNAAGVAFAVASPLADRIVIARPAPQIDSIEPLFATMDTTLRMTVRGRNLQDATALLFDPSTGIATDAAPVVNSDGTILTAGVAISLTAAIGDHVVAVTTAGGTSATAAGAANTFRVVNEIRQVVAPIVAPSVGVVLEDATAPSGSPTTLVSSIVGVALGSVAAGLSPAVGIIGSEMTLTVQGAGLDGVTGINVLPGTGLTVGSVTVAPDGKTATVPITIAVDALQTLRRIKVMAGTAEIQFASPEASQFRISLPLPEVDSITPILLQTGQAPIPLTVRGRNFQNASQIRITPSGGLTISTPPLVNGDGSEITVNLSAAANAVAGARLVTVLTPAGESSVNPAPANTITLSNASGATVDSVFAASVGVRKLETQQPTSYIGTAYSTTLGVMLENIPPPPVNIVSTRFSNALGIAVGPTALRADVNGFAPGSSGTLVVRGHQLDGLTAVTVMPAAGMTLGVPVVAPDGTQASVSIVVAATAERGPRALQLGTAGGSIQFSDPSAAQLRVGPGMPQLDSITPILARQGEIVTMTIRGSTFQDAAAVTAAPGSGITFIPGTLAVNADGTQLTVSFVIDPNAPLGSQVIQVAVPGAASDATPAPANTFTVLPP
jgi:YD repeat-containing protein